MSYMKMELENLVEEEVKKRFRTIELLALRTKYSLDKLVDIWREFCYDHYMFGEELDWDYFVNVTLEQDW